MRIVLSRSVYKLLSVVKEYTDPAVEYGPYDSNDMTHQGTDRSLKSRSAGSMRRRLSIRI